MDVKPSPVRSEGELARSRHGRLVCPMHPRNSVLAWPGPTSGGTVEMDGAFRLAGKKEICDDVERETERRKS